MPIFQDDDDDELTGFIRSLKSTKRTAENIQKQDTSMTRASGESIRTELCDGPLDVSPEKPPKHKSVERDDSEPSQRTSDRVELMERLKRGESPTWVPNQRIESFFKGRNERSSINPNSEALNSSALLPSAQFQQTSRKSSEAETEDSHSSSEIERPRSALHSGDFTQKVGFKGGKERAENERETIDASYLPTPAPWISTTPPRDFTPFQLDPRFPRAPRSDFERHTRAPSVSSSLSSSFVLMAPTSPLVQFQSNEDLNCDSKIDALDIGAGVHKRRHTLQTSHSMNSTTTIPSPFNFSRPLPNLRRDNTLPYQAHQPRRSLASISSLQDDFSVPNSPTFSRSRRPSYTSESSPLQLASMVGSYEESILRGRMSTTPSKPFEFVAKIGVLGLGKCKPYLRCPSHVTLPFPAVFYSYGTTSHGRGAESQDGPSPYVGQIDLENGIKPKEKKHKKTLKVENQVPNSQEILDTPSHEDDMKPSRLAKGEQNNSSASPRAPPGGSYRIAEKGQVQIIIKNPNNTAIKVFVVPYDLKGMPSGTKTFIRQRMYSAAPIIDGPISSSSPSPKTETKTRRPILRYLIHLHICSPSKNRYYLYKTIRVVFANRVPDGKEALRTEIQFPEPRFSPWKPTRESSAVNGPVMGAGAMLAADKAFRRRSSGFPLTSLTNAGAMRQHSLNTGSSIEPIGAFSKLKTEKSPSPYSSGGTFNRETPISPIPFNFDFKRKVVASIPTSSNSRISSDRSAMSPSEVMSQGSSSKSHSKSRSPDSDDGSEGAEVADAPAYDKLSRGDVGYGGYAGRQSASEGLLAKKLRNLKVADGFIEEARGDGSRDEYRGMDDE